MFGQPELDQLLAPIALYPDPLLGQILVAATYPLETVQAARFVRANPALTGDALAQAMQTQSWDPSVKALTQFPSVLLMMDDKLDWTQKLGDAFLAQQAAVMDTVQALRAKAQAAGTLKSTEQQNVVVQDGAIEIDPYAPNTVYVPYYNPTVVYGAWWWPGWEPFVWVPPIGLSSALLRRYVCRWHRFRLRHRHRRFAVFPDLSELARSQFHQWQRARTSSHSGKAVASGRHGVDA